MAKGKHAAALFEVIHSGRYPNKPLMNTPKWWFKRDNLNEVKEPADGSVVAAPPESDPTATATATATLDDRSSDSPAESSSSASSASSSSPADPTQRHRRPHGMG